MKWTVQMNFEVDAADEDDATRMVEDALDKVAATKDGEPLKVIDHQDTWETE